jgi:exosortase
MQKSVGNQLLIDQFLLAAILSAYVAAFWPAWVNLFGVWRHSEDYSHGFVIVPIALYVLWRKRAALRATPLRPTWLGLPLVLAGLVLYLGAHLAGVLTLGYLCLVLVPAGVVLFLCGWPILKKCAFPLFLLLFMIPLPAQLQTAITAPLQLLVSQATVLLVKFGGIPIIREGNVLHLPQHSFQVIQACSGLRSIMSLLTLSLLFAYFTLNSNALRTLLFFAGLPVAIAANVLRVLLMILGLHLLGIDLTEGKLHELFGIGIFAAGVFLLFCIRSVLTKWDPDTAAK